MGTEWGLRCKTCDALSPDEFLRGEHMLRSMVKAYPHIKAVKEADKSSYLEISIMGYGWCSDAFFSWLAHHYTHDLELQNEYGQREPLEDSSP